MLSCNGCHGGCHNLFLRKSSQNYFQIFLTESGNLFKHFKYLCYVKILLRSLLRILFIQQGDIK